MTRKRVGDSRATRWRVVLVIEFRTVKGRKMSTVPKPFLSPEQYLAIERAAETRSEYFRGEMFAMTGASRFHNLIAGNVGRRLNEQFDDRPCEVYQTDMRVKVSPTGLYTYPDIVVTCEHPKFEDSSVDTLLNPQVLFEVLSPSTESWDRGKKFGNYRRIDSLREYVLISQDRMLVEKFARLPDGEWLLSEVSSPDDRLVLDSVSCSIRLSDIYAKVELTEPADPSAL